jgi:hypothetical protein
LNNNSAIDSLTDISFANSSLINQNTKNRSNPQLTDQSLSFYHHQPKIVRNHSKTYSVSSDDQNQSSIFSPRNSNELVNDDIDINGVLLRKTYNQKYQSTPSVREQQIPASSTFKYASNEVLLKPKQQQLLNLTKTSSKDISKKLKRFSLDQHQTLANNQQQISEPHIYRSSMVIVPEHNSNLYGVQINNNPIASLSFKQTREEPIDESQQPRSKVRRVIRIGFIGNKFSFLVTRIKARFISQSYR